MNRSAHNLLKMAVVCLGLSHWCAIHAQTVLFDLGTDSSFRGASVTSPDGNGNHWNSVWSGAFYSNVPDINGSATTIDFGFDTAVGTDYYNGPAGTTQNPASAVYDSLALGNLGVDEAVYDYYVTSNFAIGGLDPNSSYNLTFYGAHKYNNANPGSFVENTTRYTVYTDNTYSTPVTSIDLLVGDGPLHNEDNVVTLSDVAPQTGDTLYIGFEGVTPGTNGYLNALQLDTVAPPPPSPTQPKVYMHYMPWFETPASNGGQWGWHWTFNNRDPDNIDAQGKREIASHFYPKIGPYASGDPDVIEYHLLLMKLSGIDGVLIDWYGIQGTNGDIVDLFNNSNALVNKTDDFGIEFGVVLEDRFAANTSQVQANVEWLNANYFNKPEYIRVGPNNDPILPVFGPITQETEADWNTILQNVPNAELLPLWFQSGDAGANSDGEYAWVSENEALDNYLSNLENYYQNNAQLLGTVGGAVYPGFDDFYQEGGVGTVIGFEIPHDDGQTLANTLNLADQYSDDLDFIQLITFNDFGEGTIFEPTIETGFDYLVQLQQFTGVPYTEDDLQLVFDLYRARKEFDGDAGIQAILDQASAHLTNFNVAAARAIIEGIYMPGDFDGDGETGSSDFLVWQQQVGSIGYYPLNTLAADGNADGIVDEKDLLLWESGYGSAASTSSATTVPEPLSWCLFMWGIFVFSAYRNRVH